MDRPQQTLSVIDELRQIRSQARVAPSLDTLRKKFDRLQTIRRQHVDDFDVQLVVADVQEEIMQRARSLRGDAAVPSPLGREATSSGPPESKPLPAADLPPSEEAAEIPPDVPKIDRKSWQIIIGLAIFFTVLVCAAFFYMIQTARRINFKNEETATSTAPLTTASTKPASTAPAVSPSAVSMTPALRLYTDLIPGSVSLDGKEPQPLSDGELILDHLQPGQHSVKLTGRSGSAAFSFNVEGNAAPKISGTPTASEAMAVLVSAQDGHGQLITSAEHAAVAVDGKPIGEASTAGLPIADLGKVDHNLLVTQDRDRQRFVLTYTSAPSLTVFVKSDPSTGTVTVSTGVDGAEVYIDGKLYRRQTERGQLRVILKAGQYAIKVHKDGYEDPPPQTVALKKADEAALQFHLQPVPQVASLQIAGGQPGMQVYLDKQLVATVGADGSAQAANIKAGDHTIELRHDPAQPKTLLRTFHPGDVISLTGPDVVLNSEPANKAPTANPAAAETAPAENANVSVQGTQVRKGPGFITYHVPKVPGHYSFQAQGRVGGFLKHNKLQWFAAYQDGANYVLFSLDGKHADIRDVSEGKSTEITRIPFSLDSNEAVQVDMGVKPNSVSVRIRTPDGDWSELGSVNSSGRDFTKGKVGFYIPSNDEIAVSNFTFAAH